MIAKMWNSAYLKGIFQIFENVWIHPLCLLRKDRDQKCERRRAAGSGFEDGAVRPGLIFFILDEKRLLSIRLVVGVPNQPHEKAVFMSRGCIFSTEEMYS